MYRLVAALALAAGTLVWPTAVVDAESVTIDAEGASLVWVDLQGPDGPTSAGASADGIIGHGDEPVVLTALTVEDDGLHNLTPMAVETSTTSIGFPADLAGVATSENGALTARSDVEFGPALARAVTSPDLRHYLRSDGLDRSGDEWGADYALRFSPPLHDGAYLVMVESDPESFNRVQAVDADGQALRGAPIAVLSPGVGWSTGFASGDRDQPQPSRLAVLDVERLLAGTDTTVLHGVQVLNDDESDFKLIPMSAAGVVQVDVAPAADGDGPDQAAPAPGDGAADDGAVAPDDAAGADDAAAPGDGDGAESGDSWVKPVEGGLQLTTTVYAGTNGGAGCDAAANEAVAAPSAAVTYCYTVTNTGTEPVSSVTVADPDLAGTVQALAGSGATLAPGASAVFFAESAPPADDADGATDNASVSMATVTGIGADTAVEYRANAEAVVRVDAAAPRPGLRLDVSAYAGANAGAGCPGTDATTVAAGDPVTYCFEVTNTGNTPLGQLVVEQLDVGRRATSPEGDGPLAPGASRTFHLEDAAPAVADTGLLLSALAEARPLADDGSDLTAVATVVAHDGTELTAAAPEALAAQLDESPIAAPSAPADTGDAATRALGGQASPTETPEQLAYTGWETWLVVMAGIGLVAGGLAILRGGERPSLLPVPVAPPIELPVVPVRPPRVVRASEVIGGEAVRRPTDS
ncbi:MAG: hypothetical protein AAGD35_19235 [Actinomycetota bacterium]